MYPREVSSFLEFWSNSRLRKLEVEVVQLAAETDKNIIEILESKFPRWIFLNFLCSTFLFLFCSKLGILISDFISALLYSVGCVASFERQSSLGAV